jgi:hypothetical protein
VSVQVRADLKSLALSSKGTLSGIIYLELAASGEVSQYPERAWSDLPVAVLSAWLPQLLGLQHGSDRMAKCSFMDGPFAFTVSAANKVWTIECEGRQGAWRVEPADFLRSLTRTSREVLVECDQRDLRGSDLELLRVTLEEIQPPAI